MKAIEYPTVCWARELPDHPAVIANGEAVPYAGLEQHVSSSAIRLRSRGVLDGDRVVICASNSLDWLIVAHALARVGAVLVPVNTRILTSNSSEFRRAYGPRMVLCDSDTMSLWESATLISEITATKSGPSRKRIPNKINPEALHSIILTSGSAGEPKGVCLSFRNHLSNALGSALNLGVNPDDRWLLNLPLYHVGGMAIILRAAIYGTTVVVHDRFDAAETWRAIEEDRVTQLSLVASTLRRLLDAAPERNCPGHVRSVLVGGGPVPSTLIDEARGRGFPILPTYGMTETSSQIATLSPRAPEAKQSTAGFPLALADIEIRDESDASVSNGVEGRIHVRGPMVGLGYWREDGTTQPFVDADGWFATNDIGSFDENGCLIVRGRIDNVIISGGEKIHAEEIEGALSRIEGVARAAVVGIEDPEWGQRPVAFVELIPGREFNEDGISELITKKLPSYKLPLRIIRLQSLPTLPSGKTDRRALMAQARESTAHSRRGA